ncbi:hypothetical protein [Streptomyces sp. NPDC088707]|uniref:hypothetical protein n=1 Tax=Streptomyces sp. NPDC088707 TaxID=3365871 RepID=UPI00380F7818
MTDKTPIDGTANPDNLGPDAMRWTPEPEQPAVLALSRHRPASQSLESKPHTALEGRVISVYMANICQS